MKTITLILFTLFCSSVFSQLYISYNQNKQNIPPNIILKKEGAEIWSKPLPLRMTYLNSQISKDSQSEVNYYLETEKYILLPDKTGLLVIDKTNGNFLLNIEEESVYLFDLTEESKFEITGNETTCNGKPDRGGLFVTECQDKLFFFNGRYLLALNSSDLSYYKEIIGPKEGFSNSKQTPLYSTSIDCKKCKIVVSGRVLL